MALEIHRFPLHDIRQHLMQEIQHETIHLFKLEQKRVVAFGTVDVFEDRVRDGGGEFFLLGVGEEAVGLDAEDQCGLLDQGKGVGDGGGGLGVVGQAAAGYVVRVEFAGDGDVAVCVEALDEFFALVAQVGLGGEVGRCAFELIVVVVAAWGRGGVGG